MIRALPIVLLLLLGAGCFSVPPYEPPDVVVYTEEATGGARVAAEGFELHFAGGPGFHFPDSLKVGGVEMIGNDPAQKCFAENQIGVRILPTARVSADGAATQVTNRLTPVLKGPIVVQARVEWATAFKCSGDRKPSGSSTFTVFPDSRIVRYDELTDESPEVDGASICSCDAAANDFNVTTFWTLARGSFAKLYRSDDLSRSDPPPQGGTEIGNVPYSCVDDDTHRLTFAWTDNRITTIRGTPNLIAFGREFFDNGNSSKLPGSGMFRYSNSSALFIGTGDCRAEGFVRAEEYLKMNSKITVGGMDATFSTKDGIFGSEQPDLQLSGRVDIKGMVNSSFAVWLRFTHPVEVVRATLANAQGRWYLPQRIDARSWLVWFREPLKMDQTITVEPH